MLDQSSYLSLYRWIDSAVPCYIGIMKIGYARVSTETQDLTAQIDELTSLGVEEKNILARLSPGAARPAARLQEDDSVALTEQVTAE